MGLLKFHTVCTLFLSLAISLPAGAEAPAGDENSDEPEEIVITARRFPGREFATDNSLSVLDGEQLLRLPGQTLPDLLQETNGVFMQRTNRGAGAPILRGMVGPQNLILVDGIRFNNSTFRTGPNQYLALIDPTAIDRLEVMLGPGSILYGSDALGGVIQVFPISYREKGGLGARAGVRFTSCDLSTAVWADAEWQRENAGFILGGTFRNLESLRAGGGVEQPISDFHSGSWRARGRYDLSGDMELGITYLGMRVRDAGRADRLYEGRWRYYDNDDDLVYLDWRYRPGGVLKELRLAPSFHRMHELVDRYRCRLPDHPLAGDADLCLAAGRVSADSTPADPLTRQEIYNDTVLTPGVLATARLGLGDERIRATIGLEAYFDFVYSGKRSRRADRDPPWMWQQDTRGNFSDGSTYRSLGAFLQAEGDLAVWDKHSIVARAGGRVSNFGAFAGAVPGLGDVEYEHTGFVGSAGVKYLYGQTFMAYANFSQGFRAPNLQESTVLGDTGSKFEVPNDELQPETGNSLEIGTRLRWLPLQAHLSAFVNFLDDVIDERELTPEQWQALGISPEVVGDKPVIQRVNSSSGRYWGMEGGLELGPWHDFELWAHLAWVRAEIENQAGDTYPARRIPPLLGAAGIRYQPPDLGLYVEIFSLFAGRQSRLHPSDEKDLRICQDPQNLGDTYADRGLKCLGTPGWVTVNVRAGYRFGRWLRLDLAATNLTDRLYRYHGSGVDAPGVGVSLALEGYY